MATSQIPINHSLKTSDGNLTSDDWDFFGFMYRYPTQLESFRLILSSKYKNTTTHKSEDLPN
ncbi:hypothetical protein V9L05_11115 [Bernardetia sp. Wsw4-3y2]|uniref:hypothetical protein n=1 Tax=Bernardetia sp. Wsw4-3y2 TaxID=3127471 RepID=UPI0030D47A71